MLLSGFRPCRYYYRREECSCRLPPDLARYRARCVVCVSKSLLSSFVIDGFDTLPRSICSLRSHVIAVIAYYCRVSGLVATTIAVGNVHTDCPRIWPGIARHVWSALARHRCRRLSLTGSTPCRARARCVVCVSTSSLSSHVIVGFPALSLLLSLWGMSTPWVLFARERCDRFCGRVMLRAALYKSCIMFVRTC